MPIQTIQLVLEVDDRGNVVLKNFGAQQEKTAKQAAGAWSGQFALAGTSVSRSLRNLERRITRFGKLAGAIFGVLLVRSVFRTGVEFERTMSAVQAITRTTGREFEALENLARRLGETTVFTAGQSAEAMENFALAGFSVLEIMQALPATLDLAAAGTVGVAEAASIAANAIRQFGLDAGDFSTVANVLIGTVTTSNQRLGDLAQALKFVGPVAKAARLSIDQTAATLGVLADRGLQATLGGTALRGMLAVLLGDLEEGEKGIGAFGIQLARLEDGSLDLAETFQRLRDAGLAADKALDAFGRRAGVAAAVLLDAPELIGEAADQIANAATVSEIASVKLDNLKGDLVRLTSAWQGLSITIFKANTGPMREFVQSITEAIRKVNAFLRTSEGFDKVAAAVRTMWRAFRLFAQLLVSGIIVARLIAIGVAIKAMIPAVTALTVRIVLLRAAMLGLVGLGIAAVFWGVSAAAASAGDRVRSLGDDLDEIIARSRAVEARKNLTGATEELERFAKAVVTTTGTVLNQGAAMRALFTELDIDVTDVGIEEVVKLSGRINQLQERMGFLLADSDAAWDAFIAGAKEALAVSDFEDPGSSVTAFINLIDTLFFKFKQGAEEAKIKQDQWNESMNRFAKNLSRIGAISNRDFKKALENINKQFAAAKVDSTELEIQWRALSQPILDLAAAAEASGIRIDAAFETMIRKAAQVQAALQFTEPADVRVGLEPIPDDFMAAGAELFPGLEDVASGITEITDALMLAQEPAETYAEAIDRIVAAFDAVRLKGLEWTDQMSDQASALLKTAQVATESAVKYRLLESVLNTAAQQMFEFATIGEFTAQALAHAVARQVFSILAAVAIEELIAGFQSLAQAKTAAGLAFLRKDPSLMVAAGLLELAAKMHFATAAKAGGGAAGALVVGAATAPDKGGGLAEGGLVTGPVRADLGEGNKRELVFPLESDQAQQALTKALTTAVAEGGGTGGGEVHFHIHGDVFTDDQRALRMRLVAAYNQAVDAGEIRDRQRSL